MSQKISVRLHPALSEALQQAARDRGVSPSGLIRAALHQFLGPFSPTREPSAALPPDAGEAVLARCPSDVQAKIARPSIAPARFRRRNAFRSSVAATVAIPGR